MASMVVIENGDLLAAEIFWRDHYTFFKEHGYTLRRRYEPDWSASWIDGSKKMYDCEDGIFPLRGFLIDATRSDGTYVMLKKLDITDPATANELAIGQLFSSPELTTDSRNHCVPILDVIQPKNGSNFAFIVMPLLFPSDLAPFQTIGEVVEYMRQILEGVQYMHQLNVAHADCKWNNILGDLSPLYRHPPHPFRSGKRRDFKGYTRVAFSRTARPVKYYLIDFGLSKVYQNNETRLMTPPWGGDKSVPEHLIPNAPPCNPFLVDVYCIGNVIKQRFLDGNARLNFHPMQSFEFLRLLVSDMTNESPDERPSMDDAVVRFNALVGGLSPWTLRSPVLPVGGRLGLISWVAHWTKQLVNILCRVSPIPRA
ncbi:hypothetical protein H0H93_006568 [Arthromyces matolae]|nr:hypothetical protein H0H93_006568 [Arthromyces matolae]